jgi:hypothetical protein
MKILTTLTRLSTTMWDLSHDIPPDVQYKIVYQVLSDKSILDSSMSLVNLMRAVARETRKAEEVTTPHNDRYYIITAVDTITGQMHVKRPIFAEDDLLAIEMAIRYYNIRTFPPTEIIEIVKINSSGTHTPLRTLQKPEPIQEEETL